LQKLNDIVKKSQKAFDSQRVADSLVMTQSEYCRCLRDDATVRIPRITPNTSLLVVSTVLIVIASVWAGQTVGWLMPVEASKEAGQIDGLFRFMLIIATGIFLGVQGVLLYSAFVFKRAKDDMGDGPNLHGNLRLEILWTAIPTALVLYLSIYSFEVFQLLGAGSPMGGGAHHEDSGLPIRFQATNPDPSAPPPLVIGVEAVQYAWIFSYPGSETQVSELHLPIGRPVRLDMKSNDVIHAFWVPEFRLKQDVIPGRTTQVSFTPTKAGKYQLRCAELCGAYHGGMVVDVIVEDKKDVDAWLKSQASLGTSTRVAQLADPAAAYGATSGTAVLQSEQTRALVGHLRAQGQ
jgi:cytochrome c oxidase subunit 2